jgi:hypothetical protein
MFANDSKHFRVTKANCPKSLKGQASKERGLLIETVLILPVLLAFVFIIIFVGVSYNAKRSLSRAMETGIRLALTRAIPINNAGGGTLVEVSKWAADSDEPFPTLLYGGKPDSVDWVPDEAEDIYDKVMSEQTGSLALSPSLSTVSKEILPQSLYSMVYVYQAMKRSVSESIKYPCSSLEDDNCVTCVPAIVSTVSGNSTGLHCSYHPDDAFLSPVEAAISMLTGKVNYLIEVDESMPFSF